MSHFSFLKRSFHLFLRLQPTPSFPCRAPCSLSPLKSPVSAPPLRDNSGVSHTCSNSREIIRMLSKTCRLGTSSCIKIMCQVITWLKRKISLTIATPWKKKYVKKVSWQPRQHLFSLYRECNMKVEWNHLVSAILSFLLLLPHPYPTYSILFYLLWRPLDMSMIIFISYAVILQKSDSMLHNLSFLFVSVDVYNYLHDAYNKILLLCTNCSLLEIYVLTVFF